jgi:Mce-associated membrane protein
LTETRAETEPVVRRRPWRAYAAAIVLVAIVFGAGAWMQLRAADVRSDPLSVNRAGRDAGGQQVANQIAATVSRVFSYSATDPAATGRYAAQVLTGNAASQYRLLFQQVQAQAATQRLSVRTTVNTTAVSYLDDKTAVVLLFCDQRATRAGQQPTTAAADLLVTADRRDGRWLISEIRAV